MVTPDNRHGSDDDIAWALRILRYRQGLVGEIDALKPRFYEAQHRYAETRNPSDWDTVYDLAMVLGDLARKIVTLDRHTRWH